MSTPTTDVDYNEASREIQVKLLIYFDATPLVVTTENYLISASLLEEAQSSSQTILGQVSSNELSFDLYNDTNIFTPTNTESTYYGKIKKNIKIEAFGRAGTGDIEWDDLGTYYVKSWTTTASGLVASVAANDRLYDVFDASAPVYPVTKDATVKALYESYFDSLGVDVNISEAFNSPLQYAYVGTDNKTFINDLTNGALAMCYGNRQDGVDVLSRNKTSELRATLTDNDQVINISTQQTIDTGYDGVSVTRNSKQESVASSILSIKEQEVETGSSVLDNLNATSSPVIRLGHASVTGNGTVGVQKITATPYQINLQLLNEEETSQIVDIDIVGTTLETVSSTEEDDGSNLLSLDSQYVQTASQSAAALRYLRRAITIATPMLSVDTRGNFKLLIGDKVRVQSSRFKTDFTGIIIRNNYSYDGGLKCTLTLMDARLFEGVTP